MRQPSITTIAFLTPIIHGHANIHFTILQYLLGTPRTDNAFLSLHVISDEPQRGRVASLPSSTHASVTFHSMGEDDLLDAIRIPSDKDLIRSPPVSLFHHRGMVSLGGVLNPLVATPEAHLSRLNAIIRVLENIRPNVFVLDLLTHTLGLDAIHRTGLATPHVMLSPGPSIDMCGLIQPYGRGFWRYPVMFTTHKYPVPLPLIPLNILYGLFVAASFFLHPKRRAIDAARNAHGLPGSILAPNRDSAKALIHASLAEIEYPHIPRPRTIFAGPIITPVAPLNREDYPDLTQFIESGGRTIYVNLGSLFKYTQDDVRAVAEAFVLARARLEERGGIQMLWKLPDAGKYRGILNELLGEERKDIRIEAWVEAPALAVLQHPNVMLSVNHGGANSIIEAMYAGCPHLVLAAWLDLYTLAVRAEWLGCGLQANKGVEPAICSSLLADAIVLVLEDRDGEEGARIRSKAEAMGRLCRKRRGDQVTAEAILSTAMDSLPRMV